MAFNRRSMFGTLAQTCDLLDIERCSVIIVGGGASLYYGLRETTQDIDVALDSECFDRIVADQNLTSTILPMLGSCPSIEVVTFGGVDFHRVANIDSQERRSHRGFGVQTKLNLLRFRVALGRGKDLSDIESLEEFWGMLSAFENNRLKRLMEQYHDHT